MNEAQKMGARIKELRLKNNMTQQELADKLKYKSRSTINKIELGINEIHPTKIREFAFVLQTTPQFIMGWDKDPSTHDNKVLITLCDNSVMEYSFDNEKIKLLLNFINSLKNN